MPALVDMNVRNVNKSFLASFMADGFAPRMLRIRKKSWN